MPDIYKCHPANGNARLEHNIMKFQDGVTCCADCNYVPEIPEQEPSRFLYCAVCGACTRGRQWWNRDTGYGVCVECIERLRAKGYSEEELTRLYGTEGVHWNVEAK